MFRVALRLCHPNRRGSLCCAVAIFTVLSLLTADVTVSLVFSDARRYAVWLNPRSRSRWRALQSWKSSHFQQLFPGNRPLIPKLVHYIYIWSGQIFDHICPSFLCHVTLKLAETSVAKSRPSVPYMANLLYITPVFLGGFLPIMYQWTQKWILYRTDIKFSTYGYVNCVFNCGNGMCSSGCPWPMASCKLTVDNLCRKSSNVLLSNFC